MPATQTVYAGNPTEEDTSKIPSYSPEMEYHRYGKTNLMVSSICPGGHWKRIDKVLPNKPGGQGWLAWGHTEVRFPEWRTFQKLREGFENGLKTAGQEYV